MRRWAERALLVCVLATCLWGTGRAAKGRSGLYLKFDPAPELQGSTPPTASIDAMKGPQLVLLDSARELVNKQTFTYEALVRIRDERLFSDTVDKKAGVRVPIMGNWALTRASTSSVNPPGIGHGIGCYKETNAEPKCCFEAWIAEASGNVMKSVCTPVGFASSGEWFHISAAFQSNTQMRVQTVRSTGEVGYAEASSGTGNLDYYLENGLVTDTTSWTPFRFASSMDVRNTGQLFFAAEHFPVFFKGDIDEFRYWNMYKDRFAVRDTAFETLEKVGGQWPTGLVRYMPVRDCMELVSPACPDFGWVVMDLVKQYGSAQKYDALSYSGTSSKVWKGSGPELNDFTGYAYNMSFGTAAANTCTMGSIQTWPNQCASNYLDKRARISTGPGSIGSYIEEVMTPVGGTNHLVVQLGQFQASRAHLFISDPNYQDTLRFESGLSNFSALLMPKTATWGDPRDYFDNGMPFELDPLSKPTSSNPEQGIKLPWSVARKVKVDSTDDKPDSALTCGACRTNSPDDCNCGIVQIAFTQPSGANSSVCNTAYQDPLYSSLCLEWYVPKGIPPTRGGWQVRFSFDEGAVYPIPTSTDDFAVTRRGVSDNRELVQARMTVNALVRYEASPEWFSSLERPLQLASRRGTLVSDVYLSEAQTPYEGQVITARVGNVVNGQSGGIVIRVRDRNEDDFVDILPLDDPGMPNGAVLRPEVFDASGKRCHARVHNIRLGPGRNLFQRTLEWTPTAQQIGRHRICFVARSYPAISVPQSIRQNVLEQPDSYYCCDSWCPYQNQQVTYDSIYPAGTMESRSARCFFVDVIAPIPVFDPPVGGSFLNPGNNEYMNFRAGCTESVFFAVRDSSVDSFNQIGGPTPYEVEVVKAGGNFPPGLTLGQAECPAGAGEGTNCYEVKWKPTLADAQGGFEACFAAVDAAGVTGENPLRRCYNIRVKKCQYCVSKGENGEAGDTFASVGAGFGLDWLLLYMANPTIRDPTDLAHGTVINLGVVYKVRPGDYLELLAQKFYTTVDAIKRLNSDLGESTVLQPGMEVCVMPPVCDVECLYGTDCHIY